MCLHIAFKIFYVRFSISKEHGLNVTFMSFSLCCSHTETLMLLYQICFFFSPHFFKDIKISALALLKMVMHARSGGTLEVMGLLLGKVDANTMIVMDSFALPVEGTETRVNAQAQAYEYMTAYIEAAKQVRILFNMSFISKYCKMNTESSMNLIGHYTKDDSYEMVFYK